MRGHAVQSWHCPSLVMCRENYAVARLLPILGILMSQP